MLRDIRDAVLDFAGGLASRRLPTYSAAGAYYIFMSLVPMIMLVCSILQYTPLTEDVVLSLLSGYIPDSLYVIVRRIVTGVYNGGNVALTVSLLLTVWTASASMKALMRGMDSVYEVERNENYIVFSVRACIYMLILLAMLILSFFVLVYGGRILDLLYTYIPSSRLVDFIFGVVRYLRYIVTMAVLAGFFVLLYRWMPAARGRYRHQWAGAVFSAITWVVFSSLFSAYISVSGKFGAYGYIGTIMVAMIWMFYCLYFLLLGGYINRYIDKKRALKS